MLIMRLFAMKYKYSGIYDFSPISKKLTKRPVIEIELFNGNKNIKGLALVDSGADKSLFNLEYATEIGIDLTHAKKEDFVGIGGKKIQCYVVDVEIQVEHIDKKFKIEVGFIESETVNMLLGQTGFFDQNRIKFEKDHDVFEIIPVNKK